MTKKIVGGMMNKKLLKFLIKNKWVCFLLGIYVEEIPKKKGQLKKGD